MDFRLTVRDQQAGPASDVWVSTPPDAPTGQVLDVVLSSTRGGPDALVDGVRPIRVPPFWRLVCATVLWSRRSPGRLAAAGSKPPDQPIALWQLVGSSGPAAGETHDLRAGEVAVGRGLRADIVVPDEEMSRRHFALDVAVGA